MKVPPLSYYDACLTPSKKYDEQGDASFGFELTRFVLISGLTFLSNLVVACIHKLTNYYDSISDKFC
ncbi:unnamed protein product [Mesocestoides corti]|uniref:Uncharacterized protein n=1 Tax=Mesocestoides corti TaxID=53468 RepID=A0A0R3U8D4_MESCO|nr:unnamed protein product [Mesocestoides corti]